MKTKAADQYSCEGRRDALTPVECFYHGQEHGCSRNYKARKFVGHFCWETV